MPSITGGLSGAPAGRFLDVSGWVGVGRGSSPTAQNAVTDSVEICLLQGLRYYEMSRAVIIRSVGRPKNVCVGAEPAQLRGVRFS